MAVELTPKDPNEVKDYAISYAKEMAALSDAIVSSVWTVPDGITKESESFTTDRVIVWLSGGTVGSYRLTNHCVTAGGREYERTVTIPVRQR